MRHELAPRARVEAHERLVEQQQARPHGEHAGERQAALLAARERVGVPAAELRRRQAHELERLVDGRRDVGLRPAQPARAEGDVLARRRGEELQLRRLEDETDLPPQDLVASRRPAPAPSSSTSPASGRVEAAGSPAAASTCRRPRPQQRQRAARHRSSKPTSRSAGIGARAFRIAERRRRDTPGSCPARRSRADSVRDVARARCGRVHCPPPSATSSSSIVSGSVRQPAAARARARARARRRPAARGRAGAPDARPSNRPRDGPAYTAAAVAPARPRGRRRPPRPSPGSCRRWRGPRRAAATTAASTSARPAGSSIAVGSSSTRTRRGTASTPASAVRCFWPPESRCGSRRRSSARPNRSSISSTRRADLLGRPGEVLETECNVVFDALCDELVLGILEQHADVAAGFAASRRRRAGRGRTRRQAGPRWPCRGRRAGAPASTCPTRWRRRRRRTRPQRPRGRARRAPPLARPRSDSGGRAR